MCLCCCQGSVLVLSGVGEVSVVVGVSLMSVVFVFVVVVVFVVCVRAKWCGWPIRCGGLGVVGGGGGMVGSCGIGGWTFSRGGGHCRAMSRRMIARMSTMDLCVVWIGFCLFLTVGLRALRGRSQSWSLSTRRRLSCARVSCSEKWALKALSALL